MLINDVVGLLENVRPLLLASWGVWLFAGLVLSIWTRRENKRLIVHTPVSKPKSAVRKTPARPAKRAVATPGDAFGELEALLEPPVGVHRRPGESTEPALASPQSLP